MLHIEELRAGYSAKPVLNDVSINVESGQFVAIVGPNGAGKTTLFKTISGIVKPSGGRIWFDGVDLLAVPPPQRAHLGIAHVPEGRQVFPSLTVMENLEMGAMTERSRRDWQANVERVFEWLPVLKERRNQFAGTMSGGQQQMLAIGRGLASSPKLLMLDEPSMGLAPSTADFIFERADRYPPPVRPDHAAGRAARGGSAGIRRSWLCPRSRTCRARRQQRDAARRRPRAQGLSRHVTDKSKDQGENNVNKRSRGLTRRTMLSGAAAVGLAGVARAQAPGEIKVGLIVPLSGIYTRPGQVMKMGAEMGIEHINAQGGIKALGGARLKLVVIDCGDTTEKAKNAAQRMVAQEPDLVAATGSYLSSFTLAVTEVTERAELPVLTLSYSDLLTDRGFRYIFQTAAPASRQSELGLPTLMKLAENASGKKPKTVAMLMDNTATSVATAKALKERLFAQDGLHLVVEEVWTPPLSDATPLIQKVRSAKPDLLLFMPNAVSDAKLGLEKISEFGLGQGKIPTVSFSITIAEPDMLQSVSPDTVQGIMTIVANWGSKGQENLIAELKAKYKEPWMTQNVISTYGDMWLMKEALEKAGKADRNAVAQAFRTMDAGPSKYYPGGELKFDEKGRRIGAGVVIVQWQSGVPVTVYPPELAQAQPFWPKKS